MKNHQLRESIKSFGSHIDPEKDVELKGNKFDIDNNVEKILKLVKEENYDETEPLVGLIEDFHKQYHSLYERHDHLTGELRERAHIKQEYGNSSSSSSSDSDSDSKHSSRRKGSKNGKMDVDFQKVADAIKEELETANLEINDLMIKLTGITEEKEALESKLRETETTCKDFKIESETLNDQKSKLVGVNVDLNLKIDDATKKLDDATKKLDDATKKLDDATRERDNLKVERETAMKKLNVAEKIISNLRSTSDQLKEERKVVNIELEVVRHKMQFFKEMNSALVSDVKNISEELTTEAHQLKEVVKLRESELSSLAKTHEVSKSESLVHIKCLEETLAVLELEVNSLNDKKREVEEINLGLQDQILNIQTSSKEKVESLMDQINNEKEQFAKQLKENKDHHEFVLTENAKKEEAEKQKLVKIVGELERKVCASEEMIKSKDKGMMDLGEEKREAIRQLCIWIDYHSSRCDSLKEVLSKARTVRPRR